jgi:hypothetical protein
MYIRITTNLESRKNELRDQIDSLQNHINMLMYAGDWNLVKLYQERQNILIVELFDLESED